MKYLSYEKYMEIKEGKFLSYLIYTKNKKLICQSEEDIKIYDLYFETKNYKLLQTIKIFTIYGASLELSNGNIISSNFYSTLIIRNNIYSNSNINGIY